MLLVRDCLVSPQTTIPVEKFRRLDIGYVWFRECARNLSGEESPQRIGAQQSGAKSKAKPPEWGFHRILFLWLSLVPPVSADVSLSPPDLSPSSGSSRRFRPASAVDGPSWLV